MFYVFPIQSCEFVKSKDNLMNKRWISYTYTVSRVTYTDEYRACIWTSLGEFRYERYESVYVTLLIV